MRRNSNIGKISLDEHATSKAARSRKSRFEHNNKNEENLVEQVDKDRYLLTYSDLITLLLGLFIILYAMSKIDAEKYQNMTTAFSSVFGNVKSEIKTESFPKPIKIKGIPSIVDNLQGIINNTEYGNSIILTETESRMVISIQDDILFSSGDADLSGISIKLLTELGQILKQVDKEIRFEGYTDNTPIYAGKFSSNWRLSVERATNTAEFLVQKIGLDKTKVSVKGFGESLPIASNETSEGRARNRRVDIVILKQ